MMLFGLKNFCLYLWFFLRDDYIYICVVVLFWVMKIIMIKFKFNLLIVDSEEWKKKLLIVGFF